MDDEDDENWSATWVTAGDSMLASTRVKVVDDDGDGQCTVDGVRN